MKGYLTSYVGLFEAQPTTPRVIEQHRDPADPARLRAGPTDTDAVEEIRATFLDVLHRRDRRRRARRPGLRLRRGRRGDLPPLDGQQRLTTLFLLHWYIASRAGDLRPEAAVDALLLRDATERPAVLRVPRRSTPCRRTRTSPSEWIKDQPWYLYMWRHDPTIQSMLVMLDAIHAKRHAATLDARCRGRVGAARPTPTIPADLLLPAAARRHGVRARTSTSR